MRDFENIPKHTEVTNKDLVIYRITMELDRVVEQGWYEDKRKFEVVEIDQENATEDIREKN